MMLAILYSSSRTDEFSADFFLFQNVFPHLEFFLFRLSPPLFLLLFLAFYSYPVSSHGLIGKELDVLICYSPTYGKSHLHVLNIVTISRAND